MSLKTKGLKDLQKKLKAAEKNVSNADGQLSVNDDLLRAQIEEFNSTYSANLSKTSTEEEIINFFQDQYVELIQDLMFKNKSAKTEFNAKYQPYAKIK